MRPAVVFLALLALGGGIVACHGTKSPNAEQAVVARDPENLVEVSPRLLSGGQPEDAGSFAALAARGVRTLVSVDGAIPDAATATRYGIRTIHVPIGYDGVPDEAAAAIGKAMRETKEGKVFIHCHHGKHRGPAAAAIAWRIDSGVGGDAARAILEKCGTGREYAGLWRDVERFDAGRIAGMDPALVPAARVDSLAERMAILDRQWDRVRACEKPGWKTPPEHPDVDPPHEAMLVLESLRETGRLAAPTSDARYREYLERATATAAELERSLRAGDGAAASRALAALGVDCRTCHELFRN